MKKIILAAAIFALLANGVVFAHEGHEHPEMSKKGKSHSMYQCPMHPQIQSDKPGRCSICSMKLKLKKESQMDEQSMLLEDAEAQHNLASEHASHLDK